MLAMVVNDDAGSLTPRGALSFFASMLAPTGDWVHSRKVRSAGRRQDQKIAAFGSSYSGDVLPPPKQVECQLASLAFDFDPPAPSEG
jgi:hypothetical protein